MNPVPNKFEYTFIAMCSAFLQNLVFMFDHLEKSTFFSVLLFSTDRGQKPTHEPS